MSTIIIKPAITIVTENCAILWFQYSYLEMILFLFTFLSERKGTDHKCVGPWNLFTNKTSPCHQSRLRHKAFPQIPPYPLLDPVPQNPPSTLLLHREQTTWILTPRLKLAVSDIYKPVILHFFHVLRKSDLTALVYHSLGKRLGKQGQLFRDMASPTHLAHLLVCHMPQTLV